MGFTPQQAGAMSVWHYMAVVDGYNAAHSTEEDKTLSTTEVDDIAEWMGI